MLYLLHIGKVNADSMPVFSINDVALPVCNSVKDLGITVNGTLAPCDHIAQITSRAFQRVNLIFRTFRLHHAICRIYFGPGLIVHVSVVRPLLEYKFCGRLQINLSDIRLVESVQRQFTKRLPGYRDFSY